MNNSTIAAAINQAASLLGSRLEAEILLGHCLKMPRLKLVIEFDRVLSENELNEYNCLIKRRTKHEPIAYITGSQPFMGLDLIVSPDVLIPRPETELLVETAIRIIKENDIKTVADLGTGSGCIAISLAKKFADLKITATDASEKALAIARQNAIKHGVEKHIQFIRNVAANFSSPFPTNFIISNPPYIPSSDIAGLDPDVKDFEPRLALDGGPDGLTFIRQLIELSPEFLILEFGIGQSDAIRQLAQKHYLNIEIIKDHAGLDRFFLGHGLRN